MVYYIYSIGGAICDDVILSRYNSYECQLQNYLERMKIGNIVLPLSENLDIQLNHMLITCKEKVSYSHSSVDDLL